jgi:hypothetical protein
VRVPDNIDYDLSELDGGAAEGDEYCEFGNARARARVCDGCVMSDLCSNRFILLSLLR